jgi:DNA repair protein SbcD/Mre11
LLNTHIEDGKAVVEAYVKREGSYVEPLPGVRVHGMRYFGAGTAQAFRLYGEALTAAKLPQADYSIVVAHAGMEGVLPDQGGLSHREVMVLRPHTDYLALGHIHKPYEFDHWIYNPGSPENCSLMESEWTDRGYYLVDVDTTRRGVKHEAVRKANQRRPMHRLSLKTDLLTTPEALLDHCREFLRRKARDLGARRATDETKPIVELQLTGVLPFDRAGLNVGELEEVAREEFQPLHVIIRNLTRATAFEVAVDEGVSRRVLERQILAELFGQDSEYSGHSEAWAATALALKNLALDGASADAIVQDLASHMARMDGGAAHQDRERDDT